MKINQENWQKLFHIINEYLLENENLDVPVVNYLKATDLINTLNLNIPQTKQSEEFVFDQVKNFLKYSQRTSHPHFNNQLYAGFNVPAFIGEMVTHLANTSMATYEISPVATLMERELVKKMNKLIGFDGNEGIMCTGGSNANMLAIHCARSKDDPDVYFKGNQKDYVIFVSESAHYSFEKAVNLMGLGLDSIVQIKNDDQGRIIPKDLEDKIIESKNLGKTPLMIGSTFGTTVMGAFDPVTEIDAIAKKYQLWHHIDGAWGGSALLSDNFSHLTSGAHLADSYTWDAHKVMGVGIITSFFLTNHDGILKQANSTKGGEKYIFHQYENRDFDSGTNSLQCGRKVDSLKLWLNWAYLGDEGYKAYVDNLRENALYFVDKLRNYPEKFKLMHEPDFLNVCFQVIPEDKTLDINKFNFDKRFEMVREGFFQTNFSKTPDGTVFFRHIFTNNITEKKHIDQFLERLLSIQ